MDYKKYLKPCRFGVDCKNGISCKFNHPQRKLYQQQKYVNDQQLPILNTSNLQVLMKSMQVNNQYQQNQHIVSKKDRYKVMKQKFSRQKHSKKQSSSSSNSDEQSNSDQQHQIKKQSRINPDQKFQQIQSLKSEDKIKFKKKRKFLQIFQQTPFDPVSYQLFGDALFQFFQKRHIKDHKRQKILYFLSKQLPYQLQTVQYITYIIQQLETQGFVQHFCYKRIIKTICKEEFIIQNIKEKLSKKINIDQKRRNKQNNLNQRFPNPVQVEFLESSDLIENQMKNKKTIYLIDGNNCLTTQKHLRYYFKKQNAISKAQAQIRFRWLVSLVIQDPSRCFIFFDDKFGDEIYEKLYDEMMTGKDYKDMVSSSTVIYAQKQQQADKCIREMIRELKQKNNLDKNDLILITADRVLIQQCYQICPLRRTSGSYLVKFVRKMVKLRQKQKPQLKKKMKKILSYN